MALPSKLHLVAALLCAAAPSARACVLQGHDSGVCVDADVVASRAPFCSGVISYRACVPKEYPWFPNHTLSKKDAWIADTLASVKARRLSIEGGAFPEDVQPWEGGGPQTAKRFSSNPDCEQAYKNYICFMNFPRCDAQQQSMMLCRSVCTNYFRSCNYPEDMVRCFAPENQGGKTPEDSTNTDPETGLPILTRAPYPGQPFRDNVVINGIERPVCTPATGAAGTAGLAVWAAVASGACTLWLVFGGEGGPRGG